MKHIRSIATGVALGGASLLVMSTFSGCEAAQQEQQLSQQNKFLVIEQLTNGKYVVVEEMPTDGASRALIREKNADGSVSERIMSEAEMRALAEQEYERFQSGQSELLSDSNGSAGMGLAGTILAVAAGSLLGNMIGNALMGNKSFASKAATASPVAKSPSSASSTSGAKKSHFGSKGTSTSGASTSSPAGG